MTDDERLAQRLEDGSMPVTECGCQIWLGYVFNSGYGQIRVQYKTRSVHRVAWELRHGPIPPGGYVCHRCDVKTCIADEHLFLGDAQSNMADKVRKGRQSRSPMPPHWTKLLPEQVRAIHADPRKQAVIAAEYGIRPNTVSTIKTGRNWRWLTQGPAE